MKQRSKSKSSSEETCQLRISSNVDQIKEIKPRYWRTISAASFYIIFPVRCPLKLHEIQYILHNTRTYLWIAEWNLKDVKDRSFHVERKYLWRFTWEMRMFVFAYRQNWHTHMQGLCVIRNAPQWPPPLLLLPVFICGTKSPLTAFTRLKTTNVFPSPVCSRVRFKK